MIQQFFYILELLTPPRKKSSLVTGRRATNARYFMFCTCKKKTVQLDSKLIFIYSISADLSELRPISIMPITARNKR
jgi:hypothetical protein